MTSTDALPSIRPRRAAPRLVLSLTALLLALSACAQGGPAGGPTDQETAVQSVPPEPTETGDATTPSPEAPSATPSTAPGSSSGGTEAPPAAPGGTALLTISISQDASADPVQYVLECVDGAPGPASTLPGAEAACAAVTRLGVGFFTARPDKNVICTQQYGGPQTASITGTLDGRSILASFALTDGCEIARWDRVRDILGTPGAQ